MIVLAIALQKGGVGKTSTTLSVGVELAALGQRILLVDLDPQSNLTTAVGQDPLHISRSVYDILLDSSQDVRTCILPTTYGPDLLPANQALANAELMLASRFGREQLLHKALRSLTDYDMILIDTPPSLGLLTVNALVAADEVLVPLQTQALAFGALQYLESAITLVREINPKLAIGGVVLTMTQRTAMSQAVEEQARAKYGTRVFNTRIPSATKLTEAPAAGQPISIYAPGSVPALAYRALAKEIKDHYDTQNKSH